MINSIIVIFVYLVVAAIVTNLTYEYLEFTKESCFIIGGFWVIIIPIFILFAPSVYIGTFIAKNIIMFFYKLRK